MPALRFPRRFLIVDAGLRSGENRMSMTIQDIADIVGCSASSVSRTINKQKGVGEATRKRILEAMRRHGYSPNAIARSLAVQKTRSIALILPDISNPFFGGVALSVDSEVYRRGYNTLLCNTSWDVEMQRKKIQFVREQRIAGIIIKPASDDLRFIKAIDVPVVLISHTDKGEFSFVDIENETAGQVATRHLAACGYERIAFLGGYRDTNLVQMRLRGYQSALAEAGLSIEEQYQRFGQYTIQSGYQMMGGLLDLDAPPDAIFCCDDTIALGAYHRTMEKGLRIPDQIGIVGFNNGESSSLPQINLTTIDQPKKHMGKLATDMLISMIEDPENAVPQKTLLYPELLVRGTTRAHE